VSHNPINSDGFTLCGQEAADTMLLLLLLLLLHLLSSSLSSSEKAKTMNYMHIR
jgi:hypothetical protein